MINSAFFFLIFSCRGRLLHGRHFTYKSINGDTAITFVSTGVEGAFATEEHPYAAHGPWLQVTDMHNYYIPKNGLVGGVHFQEIFNFWLNDFFKVQCRSMCVTLF